MAETPIAFVVTAGRLRGEVAVLADAYPLRPHVTLRTSGIDDAFCMCGAPADFVVLESDVATEPPHLGDLACRVCYDWQRLLIAACCTCLPSVIERVSEELEAR